MELQSQREKRKTKGRRFVDQSRRSSWDGDNKNDKTQTIETADTPLGVNVLAPTDYKPSKLAED